MTQEQANQVKAVHEHLTAASRDWPRHVWNKADHHALFLEMLLARAIGAREIVLASVNVVKLEGQRDEVSRFDAVVFTDRLIFAAGIEVPPVPQDGSRMPYPRRGDVAVIPRSAITAVTLHELDNFGETASAGPDDVGFTVALKGHPPVVVNPPGPDQREDGAHSRLFDSLLEGLAGK